MTEPGKTKILIAAGGGHITEAEMIIGLHQQGLDIHAAFESNSPQLRRLRDAGVPTRTLDLKGPIDLANIRRIRGWVKAEGFTILHALANWQLANFISASYGLPNKVIAYRGAVGHVSRWDPSCYLKWLNPRLDKIICVSKAVERDLKKSGVADEKLITIYKGHDLAWYANLNRKAARARINRDCNIPEDAVLVGMAANMRPVKGADLLLEVMKQLPAHVHALLIGEIRDPHLKELAKDSAIRDRVHFTGFRRDAAALIGALDINTAPSRGREGLTKTIIEGMVQGVPAIVSTAGGLPEMVDDGSSGYVFEIDDLRCFTDRLKYLIESAERRKLVGERGRDIAINRFSIDRTIETTRSLYCELVNEEKAET